MGLQPHALILFLHSLIHIPGIILGTGDRVVNEIDKVPTFGKYYSSGGR